MKPTPNQLKLYRSSTPDQVLREIACAFPLLGHHSKTNNWGINSSRQVNVASIVNEMEAHTKSTKLGLRTDGFCNKVPPWVVGSIHECGRLLRDIFKEWICRHPEDVGMFDGRLSEEWRLKFGGVSHFMLFVADFYPDNHTRKSPNTAGWLFFQPEISFKETCGERGITSEQMFNRSQAVAEKKGAYCPFRGTEYFRFLQPLTGEEQPFDWWGQPQDTVFR